MGAGWNIIQSKIAIGGGGWFGKGLGARHAIAPGLPAEHTTDFVFAVLSEEFGWVGVAVVLALYLFVSGAACGSPAVRARRLLACSPARSGWRCSSTCWSTAA